MGDKAALLEAEVRGAKNWSVGVPAFGSDLRRASWSNGSQEKDKRVFAFLSNIPTFHYSIFFLLLKRILSQQAPSQIHVLRV